MALPVRPHATPPNILGIIFKEDGANEYPMREARIAVDDDALERVGLEGLIAELREAGIRDFEELACHGNGAIVEVEVESRCDESRLAALEAVQRWDYLSATTDGHRYLVAFRAPEFPDSLADQYDELVADCAPTVRDDGTTVSLVGNHEDISETMTEFESAGITPDLRRLSSYEGRRTVLDSLTERQEDVFRTAHAMGYYEVPRDVSFADVAAELDVDPSTVAEHIQRAERHVLDSLFA